MMKRVLLLLLLSLPGLAKAQLPFATAEVTLRPVASAYSAEAVVEAGRESTLAAQVAGRIMTLTVDSGDAVKAGQLLVSIDDSEARNSIAGSQAQVAQAQANLVNAQVQYERAQKLVARKFMSEASLDSAEAQYKAAQAQLAAAKADAAQSSTTRGFATIVAPFSGLVSDRLAQVGEMASLGRPLLTLFDPATLRVVASVPQESLDAVRRAGRASIELPESGRWVEAATVTVLPAADSRTHVSQVRVELPKEVEGIYPGMFARAHFAVGETKKLMVPERAIVRRSEVAAVYVVQGEKVQLRQVRLGLPMADGSTEVLAGVAAGERIALDPVKAGIYLRQQGR
jgi:RND family efflux transporter MFP subunit